MIAGVADTHTALWYLYDDLRLSASAGSFLDNARDNGTKIGVSSISLGELVYFVEKGRLPAASYDELMLAITDPLHLLVEVPFTIGIVQSMWLVSRAEVPDMPDRIIAATGVHQKVPVISRDRRIRAASLTTIW